MSMTVKEYYTVDELALMDEDDIILNANKMFVSKDFDGSETIIFVLHIGEKHEEVSYNSIPLNP